MPPGVGADGIAVGIPIMDAAMLPAHTHALCSGEHMYHLA